MLIGRIKTLKPEEDAYGQEIWAYYMSRDSYEIIERDDGYFDVTSGPKTYFSEYKDWLSHEMRAMEFVMRAHRFFDQ